MSIILKLLPYIIGAITTFLTGVSEVTPGISGVDAALGILATVGGASVAASANLGPLKAVAPVLDLLGMNFNRAANKPTRGEY